MKLSTWLDQKGASSYNKYLDNWLDLEVTREISSFDTTQEDWNKLSNIYFPHHRYVYSFITLSNGWAVGWNENPGKGWSFPKSVIKYEL